jgi:hypothetical protein
MPDEIRETSVRIDASSTVSARLEMHVFVNLPRDHLRSACRLTRYTYLLENGATGREPGEERAEHDTFVAGSLIFAGAFVDGEVNSCYAMAAEGVDPNALPEPMRGQVRDNMAGGCPRPAHRRSAAAAPSRQ